MNETFSDQSIILYKKLNEQENNPIGCVPPTYADSTSFNNH